MSYQTNTLSNFTFTCFDVLLAIMLAKNSELEPLYSFGILMYNLFTNLYMSVAAGFFFLAFLVIREFIRINSRGDQKLLPQLKVKNSLTLSVKSKKKSGKKYMAVYCFYV